MAEAAATSEPELAPLEPSLSLSSRHSVMHGSTPPPQPSQDTKPKRRPSPTVGSNSPELPPQLATSGLVLAAPPQAEMPSFSPPPGPFVPYYPAPPPYLIPGPNFIYDHQQIPQFEPVPPQPVADSSFRKDYPVMISFEPHGVLYHTPASLEHVSAVSNSYLVNKQLPDDPSSAKRPRRKTTSCMSPSPYCCLPKSRKHRVICFWVSITVLIILAIIIGVFFPRYPQIKIYAIDLSKLSSTNTAYSFTYLNSSDSLNGLRLQMNLTMYIGTYNPNVYDLDVDSIALTANLVANTSVLDNELETIPLTSFSTLVNLVGIVTPTIPNYSPSNSCQIGTGSYGAITFLSKSWTNYTMTFLLDYSPDQQVGFLKDRMVEEIASACGITDRQNSTRPMHVDYSASAPLHGTALVPVQSGSVSIVCPFSRDAIYAVLQKVEAGESVQAAIGQVFGSGGSGDASAGTVVTAPTAATTTTTTTSASADATAATSQAVADLVATDSNDSATTDAAAATFLTTSVTGINLNIFSTSKKSTK
ncbi:hypothetical protein HDU83_004660 [Entophlyctis luteolus]|nr:hypothetical protein HDU83_004660 [Entophlyctis luteolus]